MSTSTLPTTEVVHTDPRYAEFPGPDGSVLRVTATIGRRVYPGESDTFLVVDYVWSSDDVQIDRPHTCGISMGRDGHRARVLADRLLEATVAGKVHTDVKMATDVGGQTYVQANTASQVMGRHLDSDLTRLGF